MSAWVGEAYVVDEVVFIIGIHGLHGDIIVVIIVVVGGFDVIAVWVTIVFEIEVIIIVVVHCLFLSLGGGVVLVFRLVVSERDFVAVVWLLRGYGWIGSDEGIDIGVWVILIWWV